MIGRAELQAAIDVRLAEVAALEALLAGLDTAPAPEVAPDEDDPDMVALLRAIDADNPAADPWQVAQMERAAERAAETAEQRKARIMDRMRHGFPFDAEALASKQMGRYR